MISKLMGLATVGSTWAGVSTLNRFLSSLTTVVVFAIVSALMCYSLLLGGFYALYLTLVHYGLDPYAASVTVAGGLIVLTALSVGMTITKVRELGDLSRHSAREIPGLGQVSSVAEAFMSGFARRKPRN